MVQDKIQRDLEAGIQAEVQQAQKDQEQLAMSRSAFQASLQHFEMDKGGWSDKSIESAAADLDQQMDAARADRYASRG